MVVFEDGSPVHTCANEWEGADQSTVAGDKAYFRNRRSQLIELDLRSFAETPLVDGLHSFSGVPSDPNFAALTMFGTVKTLRGSLELNGVFPPLRSTCSWKAVLSVGHTAVVSGKLRVDPLTGQQLARWCSIFLVVDLDSFEVLNKHRPLTVDWTSECTPLSSPRRLRSRPSHAML